MLSVQIYVNAAKNEDSTRRKSESDVQNLKMNAGATALIGQVHIDMSKSRRVSNYVGLCASHVLVTALLFGNDLQTQLNKRASFASYKISTAAAGNRYKNTRNTLEETTRNLIGETSHFIANGLCFNSPEDPRSESKWASTRTRITSSTAEAQVNVLSI